MRKYLLDTNHLSRALNPVSHLRDRLQQAHRSGLKLGTCGPVLCELEAGIQQTSQPDRYRHQLNRLLQHVRLWPIDETVARLYGEVFRELRDRGRVLSQVDMMLVALARHMNLVLLTSDRDFEALPDIRTENWDSTS